MADAGWKNVSRKVRQVRQVYGRESGEGNPQECPECRCADLDGWKCGRDVYIENQENRFADRNALGERMFETTWTTRDNSFKVRRLCGRRMENGWESGRGEKDKQDKGGQVCGREAGRDNLLEWLESSFAWESRALIPVLCRAILASDEPNEKRCI